MHMVEIFNQRALQSDCDLNIHMRYGLVQIMNAALILLQDENCDVRTKAVAFVSRLHCSHRHRQEENRDDDFDNRPGVNISQRMKILPQKMYRLDCQ